MQANVMASLKNSIPSLGYFGLFSWKLEGWESWRLKVVAGRLYHEGDLSIEILIFEKLMIVFLVESWKVEGW